MVKPLAMLIQYSHSHQSPSQKDGQAQYLAVAVGRKIFLESKIFFIQSGWIAVKA